MSKENMVEATAAQKLLVFLSGDPGVLYTPTEVMKRTKMSRGSFFSAIKELTAAGYIRSEVRGKFAQYAADYKNPFVRQYKVLKNIDSLRKLYMELEPISKKIVLYGSAGRGEDSPDSDLDLFVISQKPDEAAAIVKKQKSGRKVHAVIKTPSEMPDFMLKEEIFNAEIQKGVTLKEEL